MGLCKVMALMIFFIGTGYAQSNGELRLYRNGHTSYNFTSGRLQIYLNGQWGNICDTGFGMTEATVACRQLTYEKAMSFGNRQTDRYGQDESRALLDGVSCKKGSFRHILQCRFFMTASCRPEQHVSVACTHPQRIWDRPGPYQLRIQNGSYPSQGRVEFFESNAWNTLCKDNFNEFVARIVCRQLGYNMIRKVNTLHLPETNGTVLTKYGCCSEKDLYRSFHTCLCQKGGNKVCQHEDDATVECDFVVSQKKQISVLSKRTEVREYDYPTYSDYTSYSGNGTDDDTEEIVIGISIAGAIIIVLGAVIIIVLGLVSWKFPKSRPYILCFLECFHCTAKLIHQISEHYEDLDSASVEV